MKSEGGGEGTRDEGVGVMEDGSGRGVRDKVVGRRFEE